MGDRDGNFDRGPVKSNPISQELLPRGESRIQLRPWQNWGCNVGLVHTARAQTGVTIQMGCNDANAENILSSFEIRKSQASQYPAVEPGRVGSFIIISLSPQGKDCRDPSRLEEQGGVQTVKRTSGQRKCGREISDPGRGRGMMGTRNALTN
jgi:hypothetical protein